MKRPTPEQLPKAKCVHCGDTLTNDGGVLVDTTGGDVCGVNGGNEPHEIHTGPVYVTWDQVNEALDAYEAGNDSERDDVIEDLLDVYDNATPEQREHIVASAGEWVRG